MDIAKIRKKIREEAEKEKSEDKAAGEITSALLDESPEATSGGGAQQQRAASEKTEDSKQHIVDSIQGEKPQPPEMLGAQAVSESRQIGTKPEEAISGIIELLTFQLAAEEFAFRISEVEEILTPQQITMVPKAPDYILGITSVRGKVMPVLDLKKRLSIKDNGGSGKVRKKILTLKGPKGRIGIMIDRINGVIRIDESDIAEPPAHLSESDLMFVGGVVLYNGRFISVIRLEEAANINLK